MHQGGLMATVEQQEMVTIRLDIEVDLKQYIRESLHALIFGYGFIPFSTRLTLLRETFLRIVLRLGIR